MDRHESNGAVHANAANMHPPIASHLIPNGMEWHESNGAESADPSKSLHLHSNSVGYAESADASIALHHHSKSVGYAEKTEC
jgi:hypothetical protein